jgi:hypothetical protein
MLADLEFTIELLLRLGFIINLEKSVLEPAQRPEYLGPVIDSNRLSFALPIAKIEAVKAMCEAVLSEGRFAERDSIHHGKLYMGNSSNPVRTGALPSFTKVRHLVRYKSKFESKKQVLALARSAEGSKMVSG